MSEQTVIQDTRVLGAMDSTVPNVLSGIAAETSREDELFQEQQNSNTVEADRGFAVLLGIEWLFAIILALVVSPRTWVGTTATIHQHVLAAVFLGGVIVAFPIYLALKRPGWVVTRHTIAAAQMLVSALFIHLTGGRIETHFHVFGSLAFLAIYRDWRILATATIVVAVDHFVRGLYFPRSVYGVDTPQIWRTWEHAAWVIFEDIFLIVAIRRTDRVQRAVAIRKAREMGQYRLLERIGVGGMGEVYLAEHRLMKRKCAVKVIRVDRSNTPNTSVRFEREVQATAQLRHPNAIQIYDYGHTDDGVFFYAMEYLDGRSLTELVEEHGPIAPARVEHFLHQACLALREAHSRGLVHRDINPSNILVCDLGGMRDVIKLLDFGLVKAPMKDEANPNLTQQGVFLGTPTYASPEQCKMKEVDHRSDLYSLGAVGYFLLTGEPPYVRDSSIELLVAHASAEIPNVRDHCRDVPEELASVISRCLAKQPEDRFESAQELLQAIGDPAVGLSSYSQERSPNSN